MPDFEENEMRKSNKNAIEKIQNHLLEHFLPLHPNSKIKVKKGYGKNIHILIISKDFAGAPVKQRDEMVWPILEKLPKEEFFRISLCLLWAEEEVPEGVTV
jgi:stress-induced morphogen